MDDVKLLEPELSKGIPETEDQTAIYCLKSVTHLSHVTSDSRNVF